MTEQEIIEALKANQPFRGLPDVRLGGLEPQPQKKLYDVAFRLESGANGVIVYGEIKNTCTPKMAQEIAPWLARIKAAQPDTAVAIICPALSPEAQAICIENKIDFIDLAGNISINVPGKFFTDMDHMVRRPIRWQSPGIGRSRLSGKIDFGAFLCRPAHPPLGHVRRLKGSRGRLDRPGRNLCGEFWLR